MSVLYKTNGQTVTHESWPEAAFQAWDDFLSAWSNHDINRLTEVDYFSRHGQSTKVNYINSDAEGFRYVLDSDPQRIWIHYIVDERGNKRTTWQRLLTTEVPALPGGERLARAVRAALLAYGR